MIATLTHQPAVLVVSTDSSQISPRRHSSKLALFLKRNRQSLTSAAGSSPQPNHRESTRETQRSVLRFIIHQSMVSQLLLQWAEITTVIQNVQGCPRFARIAGRGTWCAGGTLIAPTHKQKRPNTHPQNKMATCYYDVPRRPEAEASLL